MLNTWFILSEDLYLVKENETAVAMRGDQKIDRHPFTELENILCFSYAGASPALMGACCDHKIGMAFLSPNGRFLCRVSGENNGNVLLRRMQYRYADDGDMSARIGRMFIFGKISNARQVLLRAVRNHSMRLDAEKMERACNELKLSMTAALKCASLEELRGIEGEAAQIYYGQFDSLILQQRGTFEWHGRNRRPPMDPINAVLSFLYTILAHDCASALEAVGLDAYVGFVHRDRPGRASLALDMMEELRSCLVDRLVLTMINRKVLTKKHFRYEDTGAVFLNDEGRKTVLKEWQLHKKEELEHPYLKEQIPWGLVPYVQALLLARFIRGDLDEYPPFLWR